MHRTLPIGKTPRSRITQQQKHLPKYVWSGAAANDPVPRLQDTLDTATEVGASVGSVPMGALFPVVGTLAEAVAGVNDFLNDSDHGGYIGQNPTASQFGANVFHVASGDD